MIDVVAYALLVGFVLSAVLVPVTALAMRRATTLRAETRHLIWFMVLLATAGATVAACAVSALRPARELSQAIVSTAVPAPAVGHAALTPLAALVGAVLACWLVVSIARTLRIARRVTAMRAMKRRATPIDVSCELPRGARALASESGVPAAVGFLHPAILLPSDTIGMLDPADARQIVLHEAAHLRRRDDLTGLVFHLCAATFWFNPFVHYIGKKLSLECEIACDELVIEQTGDAKRYATLLFEMAETMTERNPQLAWNAFVHRNGLVVRVQSLLLHGGDRRAALPRPALAALMGILLSSVGLAAFNAPALARAEDDASTHVYQMVRSDPDTVRQAAQHVRAFPVCKARRSPVHTSATVCEDTAMQFTPATMKVIPMTINFNASIMHFTAASIDFTPARTRIKKKGATP